MGQRIRFSTGFSVVVDNFKVKAGEEFGLSGLSAVEELRHHEIFDIFVVTQDLDRV
jgi:hypothetical protein